MHTNELLAVNRTLKWRLPGCMLPGGKGGGPGGGAPAPPCGPCVPAAGGMPIADIDGGIDPGGGTGGKAPGGGIPTQRGVLLNNYCKFIVLSSEHKSS